MIKVSIVTPAYNPPCSLLALYNCICEQEVESFEWLIIDDGSSVDKKDIFKEIKNIGDFRIKVHETDNKGACSARNYGVKVATGEFIKFIDCDDLLEKGHLRFLLDRYSENDRCLWGTYLASRQKNINKYITVKKRFEASSVNIWLSIIEGSPFIPTCCLFPAKRIKGAIYWDETLCIEQDSEFFFRYLMKYPDFRVIDGPSYLYNIDSDGSITNTMSRKKLETKYMLTLHYKRLYASFKEFDEVARCSICRRIDRLVFVSAMNKEYEMSSKFSGLLKEYKCSRNCRWGPSYLKMLRVVFGDRFSSKMYRWVRRGLMLKVYRAVRYGK